MDETSRRRGHNYVSLFVDLDGPRVLFATDGKDASTVKRFKQDLIEHKGDPNAIEEMCCDMSPAFISGIEKQFPEAQLTFDRFHVMKVINDAVDKVRREEIKDRPELKKSRYIWLKNQKNLKPSQTELLNQLTIKKLNLKTSRAYHIKLREDRRGLFKEMVLLGNPQPPGANQRGSLYNKTPLEWGSALVHI